VISINASLSGFAFVDPEAFVFRSGIFPETEERRWTNPTNANTESAAAPAMT
jgi:hypothetical protein